MLYQNGFPVGYNPASLYQPQPSPYAVPQSVQNPPQQSSNGIIWVQGEAGAKSYMLAPNTTLALWDSEANIIYLKSTDTSGMPSIKTLKYTIEQPQNSTSQLQESQIDMKDYLRRDEFNQYMEAFNTHILSEFSKQLKEVFSDGKPDISANAETETSPAKSDDGAV